jgi:hypothetical protein
VRGMVEVVERFVGSGPLRIWAERAGDPAHPAVLMVMGRLLRPSAAPTRWSACSSSAEFR